MKLAEFNALWAKTARGGRGDVVSLCLSGPGAAELSTDIIVNPQQSGHILHIDAGEAAALRAGGADCTLVLFEGESHGFRRADTIEAALTAELDFYRALFTPDRARAV